MTLTVGPETFVNMYGRVAAYGTAQVLSSSPVSDRLGFSLRRIYWYC